jgi:hypothetical protein
LARLVAAGIADRPLALGVGPPGSVGDQFAVVADEQVGILRIFATGSPRALAATYLASRGSS